MTEQLMFTEEEFTVLHESLQTQKEKDEKYIEYHEKGTGHPLMDSLMRVLKEAGGDFKAKLQRRIEDTTILQGKLEQIKRWQRQQSVGSTTTTQV